MSKRAYRRSLGSLLSLVLTAAAAHGLQTTDAGVAKGWLPNGLRVLIKEVHTAPVVAFQVWYRTGSADEPAGLSGVAHMLEHMLFKGTENFPGPEIPRLLNKVGARSNAFTSYDYTCFFETLASDRLELAVRVEADRMARALILPDDQASEMTVVRSELEGGENDPTQVLWRELMAAAFRAHPYQRPIIGWRPDVERMTAEGIRDYYERKYCPSNATVVIVGDVDPERAMALVERHFGALPSGPPVRRYRTPEEPQRGPRRITVRQEGTTAYIEIAFHGPSLTDRDTYAMDVLGGILGTGRSARLYQDLVETQLATSAGAGSWTPRDPGVFTLSATVRHGVDPADVEAALWEQVRRASDTLPNDGELARVKNQVAAEYTFEQDSVTSQAFTMGSLETQASWRYMLTYVDEIGKVTADQVRRVARRYLTRDNSTVAVFEPLPPRETASAAASARRAAATARLGPEPQPVARTTGPPPPSARQRPATALLPALGGMVPAADRPEPVRTVLPNGLVLIVQPNHANTTISLQGQLLAGELYDPPDEPGLAAVTADMLSRGTASRTSLQLAAATEFVGASVSISQSFRPAVVGFSGRCLTKDFDTVLDVLSDMLRRPAFPQDELDKLIARRLSALQQSLESTEARAERAFLRHVFPEGHPYRPPAVDEQEAAYRGFSRDLVTDFHARHYGPETATIVIVGDVEPAEARAAVEKHFGGWQSRGRSRDVTVPDAGLQAEAVREVIPMMDKSEATVLMGHYGGVRRQDPDFYASDAMNTVLGGGSLTSRLGLKLREELGLVYGVWSYFRTYKGRGDWRLQFGCNPDNVDKAVEAALGEVRRIRDEGATQAEFEDAVDYLTGSYPVGLETNTGVADELLRIEYYDLGLDFIDRQAQVYRSLTLDDANAAARNYLHPDRITIVIAGPRPPE